MNTWGRRGRGSRAARIAAVVVLVLTALFVIALAFTRLWLSEERIRQVAEREGAGAIAGDLEIGSFDWTAFPSSAAIEDFVLRDLEGRVVLSVDRADVTLEPAALLGRSIQASVIDLEGALVRLVPGETGALSILEALAPPEPTGDPGTADGWDVIVERTTLTGGRVEMETAQGLLVLEGLSIEDSTLAWEAGELVVTLDVFAEEARLVRGEEADAIVTSLRIEGLRVQRPAGATVDDYTVSIERMEADQVQVEGISARLEGTGISYEGRRVRLEELLLDLFPGRVEIRGEVDLTGPEPIFGLTMGLRGVRPERIAGEWVEARLLPDRIDGRVSTEDLRLSPLQGRIRATLELVGLPSAIIDAVPEDAVELLPAGAAVDLSASIDDRQVSLEALEVRALNLEISAEGLIPRVEGAPLELRFDAVHTSPASVLSALEAPFSATRIALAGDVTGDLTLPGFAGTLTAQGVAAGPLSEGALRAPLRLEGGTLYVDDALLEAPIGQAGLRGQVDLLDSEGSFRPDPPISARVELSQLELSRVDETGTAEGMLEALIEVDGSLRSPSVEGRIGSVDLRVLGIDFDSASASFEADSAEVRLVALDLSPSGGGLISGTGSLDLETEAVELRLALNELSAALLSSPLEQAPEVQGRLDGRIDLTGSLDDPRLDASLASELVSIDSVPIGRIEALAEGDLGTMEVDLLVEGAAGRLRVEGTVLPRERRIDSLILRGDDLLLHELPGAERLPVVLAGRASIELFAEGELTRPVLRGILDVDGLAVDGQSVHRGRLQSRIGPLEDGAHAIGIALPGVLFVRVRLAPGPPLEIEAWAEVDGLQLAWILPGLVEAEIDAKLIGQGEVRYRRDPTELFASLLLPELELTIAGQTLSATQPIRLRYEDDTFILEDLDLQGPAGSLQAGGAVGPVIDFLAFGRLDAGLIAAFAPQVVRAEGAMAVDLRVTGTMEEPLVTGNLELAETLRFVPRGMLREVVVESLSMALFGDRVELGILAGHITGSPFVANGFLVLDGLQPTEADFSLRGEGLPIRAADLTGEVNVDLRLTSLDERLLLSGRVDAVRGRYQRDFTFSGFSLVSDEPIGPPEDPSPFLELLDLDLRVISIGAVDVLADAGSFGLDLVLDADLRIGGRATNPRIEGRVAAARGFIRTPRADLPIVRGFVDFVPIPGNPMRAIVDVLAEGEVLVPPSGSDPAADYFLALSLDGELEELALDLVSQPPLDRLEILALLVTGQVAPRSLVPGDGRHVESAFVFAGTRLAEPLTRMITERLEDALNLEVLAADVTTEGVAISAGAEISRRLRLEGALQQGFGDTGAMALARARYLLSNTVFLEAAAQSVDEGSVVVPREREGSRGTIELRVRVLGRR